MPVLLESAEGTLEVRLDPRPVELEGLEVSSDRRFDGPAMLERRIRAHTPGSTVRGQLAFLSTDAPSMVDYPWEEARALLLPCPGDELSWEWSRMQVRGRRIRMEVRVDDAEAPGGAAMLPMYEPEELFRVELLPALAQIRLYTRPYVAHLNRTGNLPPIWPRWLGGCMGGDVAWSPPSRTDPPPGGGP